MVIKVSPHVVKILREQTEPINEKEIDISKCHFEFDEEITNDYTKEAYFTLNGSTYKQILVNNECDIPGEVLTQKGELEIGVVSFLVENEEEIKRYNPTPDYFTTWKGSLKEAQNSEPITPSDKEQIEQELLNISTQMNNLDIDAEKEEHTTTVTITKKDGTEKVVQILDGEQGPQGEPGVPGAVKFLIVAELPTDNIQTDAIYLVPREDPSQTDMYDEYMYVTDHWELLGEKQITVDLTDYVKFTDYATASKGGVIKTPNGYALATDNSGNLYAVTKTYEQYTSGTDIMFIGKGTLENVLTAKIGDINSVLDAINGEVI